MTDRSLYLYRNNNKMSKGEETRQFIIEKAAPIFNTKGIEATAMSDIMEATKLSKGSLYVHFENKDELACSVVDYNFELMSKKMGMALQPCKSSKEQLFAFIDYFKDPLNPPVFGGCPMINFGIEADDTNPIIKEKVHGAMSMSQNLISSIIVSGIKSGEFKSDWNHKEFATIAFSMLEGASIICRVAGSNAKMTLINKTLKQMVNDHTK